MTRAVNSTAIKGDPISTIGSIWRQLFVRATVPAEQAAPDAPVLVTESVSIYKGGKHLHLQLILQSAPTNSSNKLHMARYQVLYYILHYITVIDNNYGWSWGCLPASEADRDAVKKSGIENLFTFYR